MLSKMLYAAKSIRKRYDLKSTACPSCGEPNTTTISGHAFAKWPTALRHCRSCKLLHRIPTTLQTESKTYYEKKYRQKGLTTDLPPSDELAKLKSTNFKGSEKDFSPWIPLFELIARRTGRPLRVLDYGANWGYSAFQMAKLPSVERALCYEYSENRRTFGEQQLNVEYINENGFNNCFDLVFSSHVIEHMHNPSLLRVHVDKLLAYGGYCVLTCPNGSMTGLLDHPKSWRRLWGEAHPNMISDEYLVRLFSGYSGGIFNESFSENNLKQYVALCESELSSYLPTTLHLIAVMKRQNLPSPSPAPAH